MIVFYHIFKPVYMKAIKAISIILFGLIYCQSYSQDLIVKRDSSVIFCKISKVDSTTIYYRQSKGEQTFELSILKTEVVNFYKKNATNMEEVKKMDTLVKALIRTDTIKVQQDTLQSKMVEEVSKKDSAQTKTVIIKLQSDSVFLNKNYKCFYKGEPITRKEALDLMKRDTSACKEMKKARACFAPVIPLGLGAAILAGVFIGDAISGNFKWWGVGGGTIVLSVIAISLKHACNIHIANAVKIYNTHNRLPVASIPKYELGVASGGVGISFKF